MVEYERTIALLLHQPAFATGGNNSSGKKGMTSLTEQAHIKAQPLKGILLGKQPLYYRTSGTGFPLILLHGWGGSSRYWHSTMAAMSDSHTSYALDLPGYGQSPSMVRASSAARMAELVIAFADALGLAQFDLNGHSFGGAVACYIAARHPERVRRLILTCYGLMATEVEQLLVESIYINTYPLVEAIYPWLGLLQPWEDASKLLLATTSLNPVLLYAAVRPFFFDVPTNMAMVRIGYNEFLFMDQRTSLASTLSLGDPQLAVATHAIRQPTLLIGAQQDAIVLPGRLIRTAQVLPHSKLVWIELCGHAPMIERPDVYEQLVREFLQCEEGDQR